MSKHLKAFIVALLTVCMTACLGIFAAACDNKPDDEFPTSVSITVKLPDNTPAQGIWVQLCVVAENNTLGACLEPVETNAQGVATINKGIDKANGKMYEVHLTGVPTEYQYVDASGTPYEKGKGVHVDITNPSSLTITLKTAPIPDPEITLKAGNNSLDLAKSAPIDVTIDLGKDAEAAGYFRLTATDMFNLTGTGLNVTNTNDVVLHLTNGDKLSLSLADDADINYPYSLNIGLVALANGSSETPLTADIGSTFVLNLKASQTLYISNDAYSPLSGHVALDVDGTNFKANYGHIDYTEKFTVDPEAVFSVGTADGTAGVVTLNFTEPEAPNSDLNPYVAELDKTVTAEVSYYNGYYISFTATEDGDYAVNMLTDDTFVEETSYTYDDLTSFHLSAGETIVIFMSTVDMNTSGERSIKIVKL